PDETLKSLYSCLGGCAFRVGDPLSTSCRTCRGSRPSDRFSRIWRAAGRLPSRRIDAAGESDGHSDPHGLPIPDRAFPLAAHACPVDVVGDDWNRRYLRHWVWRQSRNYERTGQKLLTAWSARKHRVRSEETAAQSSFLCDLGSPQRTLRLKSFLDASGEQHNRNSGHNQKRPSSRPWPRPRCFHRHWSRDRKRYFSRSRRNDARGRLRNTCLSCLDRRRPLLFLWRCDLRRTRRHEAASRWRICLHS